MKTSNGKRYGFRLAGVQTGDQHRPVARFTCTGCGKTLDIAIRSGQRQSGHIPVTSAQAKGWEADAYDSAVARCPHCLTFKSHNDPNSELRKTEARMAAQPTLTAPTGPTTLTAPTPPATPIREPTAEQRATIRGMIEKHFDEDEGCYIGEATDQTIATVVNVPRVAVERLREAAYGPIRITTDQVAIRKEIAAVRAKITDVQDAAKSLFETIHGDLGFLRKQLAELEKRNGMKAA